MNEPTELAQRLYQILEDCDLPVRHAVVRSNGSTRLDIDMRRVLRGLLDPVRIVVFARDDQCLKTVNSHVLKEALVKQFSLADNAIAIILCPTPCTLDPYPWAVVDPTKFTHDLKENASTFLRGFLLDRFSLARLNPYSSTRAVKEDMFFGRAADTEEVCDGKDNYVIVGPRRGGKTSFGYHVLSRLRENPDYIVHVKSREESATLYSATYVDLQRIVVLDDLWKIILRTMGVTQRHFVGGIGKKLELQARRKLVAKPAYEVLSDLIGHRFKKTMLVLDEVDGALSLDESNGWPVFSKLRALVDRHADKAKVVLLGYDKLYHCAQSSTFPFSGRALVKRMGNLDPQAVEQLVRVPMEELGFSFDNLSQIVERINAATGGMPNLTQDLCQQMLQNPETQETRRILLRNVSNLIKEKRSSLIRGVLSALEQLESPLARLFAYLCAGLKDEHGRPVEEFRFAPMLKSIRKERDLDINERTARDAFDYLYLHNIFQTDDEGRNYTFASNLVREELDNDDAEILVDVLVYEVRRIHGVVKP